MSTLSANKITDLTGKLILNNTGSILQVVQGYNAGTNTTSSSYTATGLSCNITPFSTQSKILIFVSGAAQNTGAGTNYSINRGSTPLSAMLLQYASGSINNICSICTNFLDSPSTTSTINYNTTFNAYGGGTSYIFNQVMILMEVSG